MSLGQMLIVMLALVLFSTLILAIYTSMTNQMTMATQTSYQNQAVLIAKACFDKLESEYIIAPNATRNFTHLYDDFPNEIHPNDPTNLADALIHLMPGGTGAISIGDATYTPYVSTRYWTNFTGGGGPSTLETDYMRLTCRVRISTTNDPTEDYWAGDDSEDFNSIKTTTFTPGP